MYVMLEIHRLEAQVIAMSHVRAFTFFTIST